MKIQQLIDKLLLYYKVYSNLNIFLFILFNITLMVIINLLILYLPFTESLTNPEANNFLENKSIGYAFFMIVVFGPLLETLIFQAFVIKICFLVFKKIKVLKIVLAVLLSSLLFASNHPYSITYFTTTFFYGDNFIIIIYSDFKKNLFCYYYNFSNSLYI